MTKGIYFSDELSFKQEFKRHQKEIEILQKLIEETTCVITKNQLKFCLDRLFESKAELTSKIGKK